MSWWNYPTEAGPSQALSSVDPGRRLESPLAKRVESGSTKSVDSEDWVTLARASGQPMIKGPNFEPGATARRFWNPKAGKGGPNSRFSCYKSLWGQRTGGGLINCLGLIRFLPVVRRGAPLGQTHPMYCSILGVRLQHLLDNPEG